MIKFKENLKAEIRSMVVASEQYYMSSNILYERNYNDLVRAIDCKYSYIFFNTKKKRKYIFSGYAAFQIIKSAIVIVFNDNYDKYNSTARKTFDILKNTIADMIGNLDDIIFEKDFIYQMNIKEKYLKHIVINPEHYLDDYIFKNTLLFITNGIANSIERHAQNTDLRTATVECLYSYTQDINYISSSALDFNLSTLYNLLNFNKGGIPSDRN